MEYRQVSILLAFNSLAGQWESSQIPKGRSRTKSKSNKHKKDSLIQSVKPHYGLIEARNKLGQTHRSSLFPTETTQTLVHPSNRSSIQLAHADETSGIFS